MGLDVELQDEWGGRIDSIGDPKNLLARLLPTENDPEYVMLSAIDPYGDTVFNGRQMVRFLLEWAKIACKAETSEEKGLVAKIESLAHRCRNEVHTYLKFIGD
jgi:hypothetical protein